MKEGTSYGICIPVINHALRRTYIPHILLFFTLVNHPFSFVQGLTCYRGFVQLLPLIVVAIPEGKNMERLQYFSISLFLVKPALIACSHRPLASPTFHLYFHLFFLL